MDYRIELLGMADQQHQTGYVFEAFNGFHVRYYATENRDGKLVRVQKPHKLCRKDLRGTRAKLAALLARNPNRSEAESDLRKTERVRVHSVWKNAGLFSGAAPFALSYAEWSEIVTWSGATARDPCSASSSQVLRMSAFTPNSSCRTTTAGAGECVLASCSVRGAPTD